MNPTPIPAIEYLPVVQWLVGFALVVAVVLWCCFRSTAWRERAWKSLGEQGDRLGRIQGGE